MKQLEVKICGIRRSEDVDLINDFEVTFAGFIFAESKRKVSIEQAKILRDRLKSSIIPVGVFMDASAEDVIKAIETVGLGGVQLHGEENSATIEAIYKAGNALIGPSFFIWKTIKAPLQDTETALERQYEALLPLICEGKIRGLLLDTTRGGQSGGTGIAFDWAAIPKCLYDSRFELILAGGINPDNLIDAYEQSQCVIMDVNSGVEVALCKDRALVEQLMKKIETINL